MRTLSWKLAAAAAAVIAVAAGGGAWWWIQGRAPDVSYRTARIERGPLQATVSASGAVNPVTQVSVGTQVSGQIKELHADFNSEVKAGQLIALIDPETFEYRVRQSQADVDAAQAAVLTAQANAAAARAAVSRARVDLAEAQRDFDRKATLVERQFIAQSEADKARALVNSTTESLKSAQAQVGVTEAQIKTAEANVKQRQAALAQAKVDLGRTRILSPVNGIVIKRAVERGQTVAASLQAPELFVIAQNLQDMQVDASIDESDVGRIRAGQRATFTVDAYPGQTFEGQVRQVRKAAQNVANVVTYVAVVGFANAGGRLLPGMTANVRVVTDSRENALKVPNAALRVRIAGVEPAAPAARPASGTTSGLSGWSWLPQALAQPAAGGMAATRERLVEALGLSVAQQGQLDAITAEQRPRFAALRDLPEEQRGAARQQAMAQMRAKISAMLTPAQKAKYDELLAQAGGPGAQAGPRQAQAERRAAGGGAPRPAQPAAAEAQPERGSAQPAASAAAAGPAVRAEPVDGRTAAAPVPSAPASGASGASGPTGPLQEFRARLRSEVKLTPSQVEQVEAIYAEARPRFMQLRDLPAEERTKARERISAEIRARIADILTPQQKPLYAALLAETAGRAVTRGRIYLLGEDSKPQAYNVRLGITDGTATELIVVPDSPEAAVLKEGAVVITGVNAPGAPAPGARGPAGPRMPF